MRRIVTMILLLALAAMLFACGGGGEQKPGKTEYPVFTVNGEEFELSSDTSHGALHFKHGSEAKTLSE